MEALWMKRFRCPDCSAVHTCRPLDFLKGLRFSAEVVSMCLCGKIEENRWFSRVTQQNQQYWYRCLREWASRQANVIKPTLFHLILPIKFCVVAIWKWNDDEPFIVRYRAYVN